MLPYSEYVHRGALRTIMNHMFRRQLARGLSVTAPQWLVGIGSLNQVWVTDMVGPLRHRSANKNIRVSGTLTTYSTLCQHRYERVKSRETGTNTYPHIRFVRHSRFVFWIKFGINLAESLSFSFQTYSVHGCQTCH